MRITKINIPKELINNGLESVKMHRLGQVVLLTGKNGSGKTRLLELILNTLTKKPKAIEVSQAKANLEIYNKELIEHNTQLEISEDKLASIIDDSINSPIKSRIESLKRQIKSDEKQIKERQDVLSWNLIETDKLQNQYVIVPFIPKSLNLQDSNNYNKNQLKTSALHIDAVGVNSLAEGTFARIQVIQERFYNATHQNIVVSPEEKTNAIDDYNKLKDLIKLFLNTELERNIDGEPTIFGFPLGKSKLSDGQKVLIQLCLAIHCQNKSLDELILFLDEPENHLHPSVIIETIDRIINLIPNGQIWISTHSIPLIASFNPSNVWYIDQGKVSYAGSIPEIVLSSLIGDENQVSKLQDFISLPGIFALNRYAFESLFKPVSVITDKNDNQSLQIRDEIKLHLKDKNKIRILDFGAGKGRLLCNIIENNKELIQDFIKWFEYIAYDKFNTDKPECISILEKIFEEPEKRYFNDFNSLFTIYDRESFDVVIMCNVLQEIDPNDWLRMFSKDGDISNLLSENGILLIVEDQEIPVGEKAFQKGFIVLDTPEIKELFQIKERDTDFGFSDVRNDGRLKAHRIKKEYLKRITDESRISCLKILNRKSLNKILEIRSEELSYRNGKKHGFWIQQLANTTLCLEELTNNNQV
ncbi:MAG: hypothetical protein A2033_08780 [Bacteroidetes bacterium GWA2_31_9]|nr:MAG: hypothetical protein A2033_08780 [Bacteroidetes bacterium GWA2_31_9]